MKRFYLATILSFLFSYHGFGQTQMKMNKQASAQDEKADDKLTAAYKKILKIYKSDTLFIKNLRTAENAWLRYRDYQVKARFPDYKESPYGSMLPMCVSEYSKQLTEDHRRELEEWLVGIEEGDCVSSIKPKDELPAYTPVR
jgi:uncharacterized protein YecT (DUF1311 family)